MTNPFFKYGITALLALVFSNSLSQNFTYNDDIDTAMYQSIKPAYELWSDFLQSGSDSAGAEFWNEAEVEKYGETSYWLIEKKISFFSKDLLKYWSNATYGYIHTLKITDDDNGLFKISAYHAMHFPNSKKWDFDSEKEDSNAMNRLTFYFFHIYCKEENGKLKLFNAMSINSEKLLNHTTVGYLNYHYPQNHIFNNEKANRQNDFILELCKNFKIKPRMVDYYFTHTVEELDQLRGFDYVYGQSGRNIPSGQADSDNDVVYCTGTDEYYPHELVHVFLTKDYSTCHNWLNEGIATFLGGSRGESLQWHAQRTSEYLDQHLEIDLDSCLNYINIDDYTDYRYVLGGLLMKKIYEKGGYDMIKEVLNSGRADQDFYNTVEKYLSVKQEDLNEWFRGELNKY